MLNRLMLKYSTVQNNLIITSVREVRRQNFYVHAVYINLLKPNVKL